MTPTDTPSRPDASWHEVALWTIAGTGMLLGLILTNVAIGQVERASLLREPNLWPGRLADVAFLVAALCLVAALMLGGLRHHRGPAARRTYRPDLNPGAARSPRT